MGKTYFIFFFPSSLLFKTETLRLSGNGMRREPKFTPGLFNVFLIDGVNIGGIVAISSDESPLSNTVSEEISGAGASTTKDVEPDCPVNTGNASLSSAEISPGFPLESLEDPPTFSGEML